MNKQQKTAVNMAKFIQDQSLLLLDRLNELDLDHEADFCEKGVVCGRGRNPTLRLWPAIFSGEIDVFPSERRNMGQEIGR